LEFYQLGFEPVSRFAAEHGDGVADLLDAVIARMLARRSAAPSEDRSGNQVAIVGRPNVGKSSLVNRLLREERVMVNEMPGTTRDTVDVLLLWPQAPVPDPGHRGHAAPRARFRGRDRSRRSAWCSPKRAMARADVAVLVVDAVEGAGDREGRDCRRGGAVGLRDHHRRQQVGPGAAGRDRTGSKAFDDKLRFQLKFLEYAPILHLSALTGERTPKLLEADRSRGERAQAPRDHLGAEPFLERITAGQSAGESRPGGGADPVRRADGVEPPEFVSSRTWPRSCTSRTSGSSSTSCATRSASRARRSVGRCAPRAPQSRKS
jgi:GTP-binding protein